MALQIELSDLADKKAGYPVTSEFQINDESFFSMCLPNTAWDIHILKYDPLFI